MAKERKLLCYLFSVVCFLFVSCDTGELPVKSFSIVINQGSDSFEAEKAWLEEKLSGTDEIAAMGLRYGDTESENSDSSIVIDFFSSWEFESPNEGIIVSKTWFVPCENPLTGRLDTSFELCLEGKENLVSIEELRPPFTALRVDGYAAGDEEYPLIHAVYIRLRLTFEDETNGGLAEKVLALEDYLRELPKPLVEKKPVITWISSAGDMMLNRNAGRILLDSGPRSLLGGVAEIFSGSDLTIVNLEGALSSRGTPAPKTYTFRFEPPAPLAAAIKNAGIDAVLFTNNHSFDYGETAFLDSLDYLEEAGIPYLGAGRNENEALTPFKFEKEDFSARLWGLGSFAQERTGWDGLQNTAGPEKPGILHARREGAVKIGERLGSYKEDNESLNIVLFHGGEEWSTRPNASTREIYSGLIREGADLIIGSHPHIVQGFEWVEGKLIFWSLGNFVFAGMENTGGGDEGLLVRLGYRGKQPVYIEPFALALSGPRVDIAPPEKLNDFYAKSRALTLP